MPGTTKTRESSEPRTPLSRERVLRAAVALADKGGVGELTIRKLAKKLCVEAMSTGRSGARRRRQRGRKSKLVLFASTAGALLADAPGKRLPVKLTAPACTGSATD